MQTVAAQSNLTIRSFRPQPVVTRQLHAEWPINIELDGTYHNLGLFYDRISRFSRIINIGNVSIKAKDNADQQEAMSTLSQQSARENAGTTSLGALLRAKLDNN